MKYATKKDLIEKYSSKRKALDYDDVEDLLECTINYFNATVGNLNNPEIAYKMGNFGTLYDEELNTRDLIDPYNTTRRINAEKKLQQYILYHFAKLKKIEIQDDKLLRI